MDPNLQKKIYRTAYPPYFNRRLTPFLNTSIGQVPGNTSVHASAAMVPIHSQPLYNQTKTISADKVTVPIETITVPKSTDNLQEGFGKRSIDIYNNEDDDNIDESEIDSNSVKSVDPAVLSAFERPVLKTTKMKFKPKTGITEDDTTSPG